MVIPQEYQESVLRLSRYGEMDTDPDSRDHQRGAEGQ